MSEIGEERWRTHQRYTVFSRRNKLSRHQMSSKRLVSEITELYNKQCCDGIFLPLVDNLGVKLGFRAAAKAYKLRRGGTHVVANFVFREHPNVDPLYNVFDSNRIET